jgi:hypothetical protein
MFMPLLESSRLPLIIPQALMAVGAQVSLWLLNAVLFLVMTSSFVERCGWVG